MFMNYVPVGKEAQAKQVGLWASSNLEKLWERRKDKREGR